MRKRELARSDILQYSSIDIFILQFCSHCVVVRLIFNCFELRKYWQTVMYFIITVNPQLSG